MSKSAQIALINKNQSSLLAESVLNGLTAQIVVLNEVGEIVLVNQAWHDFAVNHLPLPKSQHYIGVNYLTVCDHAVGENFETAAKIAKGIRLVMRGELTEYSTEYRSEFDNICTWFTCRVTSFSWNSGFRIVISHVNIHRRKLAELGLSVAAVAFESQEGMVVTDAHKKILRVNSAFNLISGFLEEEVVGLYLNALHSGVHEANFL